MHRTFHVFFLLSSPSSNLTFFFLSPSSLSFLSPPSPLLLSLPLFLSLHSIALSTSLSLYLFLHHLLAATYCTSVFLPLPLLSLPLSPAPFSFSLSSSPLYRPPPHSHALSLSPSTSSCSVLYFILSPSSFTFLPSLPCSFLFLSFYLSPFSPSLPHSHALSLSPF